MKTLIGTPVHRAGAYALEKFLANQKQIQQNQPECYLALSTDDTSYTGELKNLMKRWELRGQVISFRVNKPDYAKSRLWNIASGRESIRQFFLSQPETDRLLFLDSDMTYDPSVVRIMEKEISNHDAVFSGYKFRNNRIGLTGAGCFLLKRKALEKIVFRCYEFKNGQTIYEDNIAEMDLFGQGCRIKKGFFLSIDHYASPTEVKHIDPQRVGVYRKVMTSALVRYCLIKTSVTVHYNIASQGQRILWSCLSFFEKLRKTENSHP